jgi:hypothetical protein
MWWPETGLEGQPDGFPVVVETNVDAGRAATLWTAVDEGTFLDTGTASVEADLLTYNARLSLFGSSKATFQWTRHGTVEVVVKPAGAFPAYPKLQGPPHFSLVLMIVFTAFFVGMVIIRTSGAWLAAVVRLALRIREALLGLREDTSLSATSHFSDGLAKMQSLHYSSAASDSDPKAALLRGAEPSKGVSTASHQRAHSTFQQVALVQTRSAFDGSSPLLHTYLTRGDVFDTAIAMAMLLAVAFYVNAIAAADRILALPRYTIYDSPQVAQAR